MNSSRITDQKIKTTVPSNLSCSETLCVKTDTHRETLKNYVESIKLALYRRLQESFSCCSHIPIVSTSSALAVITSYGRGRDFPCIHWDLVRAISHFLGSGYCMDNTSFRRWCLGISSGIFCCRAFLRAVLHRKTGLFNGRSGMSERAIITACGFVLLGIKGCGVCHVSGENILARKSCRL